MFRGRRKDVPQATIDRRIRWVESWREVLAYQSCAYVAAMRRYHKSERIIITGTSAPIGTVLAYVLLAVAVTGCAAQPKEPAPARQSGSLAACFADCRTGCGEFFDRDTHLYNVCLSSCRDECRLTY